MTVKMQFFIDDEWTAWLLATDAGNGLYTRASIHEEPVLWRATYADDWDPDNPDAKPYTVPIGESSFNWYVSEGNQ